MMVDGKYFPTDNEAHIKVFPKKGRNTEIPSSYRPISLIHQDSKIMSKILASRLARVIPSLIHLAQSGFVKGRSAVINMTGLRLRRVSLPNLLNT